MTTPTKAGRAITALREAATALEELPVMVRRHTLFGPAVSPEALRAEADVIEAKINAARDALAASEPEPEITVNINPGRLPPQQLGEEIAHHLHAAESERQRQLYERRQKRKEDT